MFAPMSLALALHVVTVPSESVQGLSGPCAQERATQRVTWRAAATPRAQPDTADGSHVRHFPTAALGAWVVEVVGAQSATSTLVTSDHVTRVEWAPSCASSTDVRSRPRAVEPRFTDTDLSSRLASGARGVVYVWSPHMPLSVDAFTALLEAAKARKLAVDVVLDPAADRAFATRVATARGLPSNATRAADSVELQFRDVLLHAPTVQAYTYGVLVGSPFPGGHTEAEYGAYLDRVLATGAGR